MDSSDFDMFFNSHKLHDKMDSKRKMNQQDSGLIPSAPEQSLDSFQLTKSSFDFRMSQVLTPRPTIVKHGDMHLKSSIPQMFDIRKNPVVNRGRCFGMKPEIATPVIYSQSQSDAQDNEKACKLRSIEEIPSAYRHVFKFQYFNYLQTRILDEVLYTDRSVVVSAPTGSGKTAVFEIALIRLLMKTDNTYRGKIIYMAPMKALCTERYQDWQEKFPDLKCLKVTGDSEIEDVTHLKDVNLICTTPEKWDSMSRRWKDKKGFFHGIRLFLIDEIHVLNDKTRGATVEAVVSRMKTLQTASSLEDSSNAIRFIAVSATLPNYNDIAEWLSTPSKPATSYNIEEKYRPVKIERFVIGYPFKKGSSDFRFDMNLSYRLRGIIDTHCHGKPTLVFCSSRKSVIQSGEILAKNHRSFVTRDNALVLQQAAMTVHEQKVSDLLSAGIGVHHAGITLDDRHTVEELFRNSQLPVLISTSTLAMGVNLPAHLVVIKSTHFYNMGTVEEYSDMQLLQMIGRAGRPQFDSSAAAVIMTKDIHKYRYESLVNGTQLVESSLHKNLIEHLNAEIVLQTITDMAMAIEWMRQTFLYVRVLKNPKHYGLSVGLQKSEVEKMLQDLCLKDLNMLTSLGLVAVEDESYAIIPQETGRLMARYCIAFETMKHFLKLEDHQESVADMIDVVSACAEFEDIQLRINEKRILNSLNRDKSKESIRFPLKGKIKNKQMKVNCLIQAQLSCLPVQDFSLSQDITKIFRVGQRVAKCLMELFYLQAGNYSLMLHAVLVYKGLKTRLWFDSRLISRQLDGIGPTMSLALAKAGLSSFQMLEQAHPRDIEVIVNRHPPFGNQIKDCVSRLPRYELAIEQVNKHSAGKATLSICIDLLNRTRMDEGGAGGLTGPSHQALLLIGDEDNAVVFKWRIMDNKILNEGSWTRTVEVKRADAGPKLNISLLSLDWVGLDIQTEYEPVYSPGWTNLQSQVPASKLKDSMDRIKQRKNLSNPTNGRKDAVKRPQESKGQPNSTKQAKIESENTSKKADILGTILNDMDKTFPVTKSRITLNKFAYEKPKSLNHGRIEPNTSKATIQPVNLNETMENLNPSSSNKTENFDSSCASENKMCTVDQNEDECVDWNDDDLIWDISPNFDTDVVDDGNIFQHHFDVAYLNEESKTPKQKIMKSFEFEKGNLTPNAKANRQNPPCVSQAKQRLTNHRQNSDKTKIGFGIPTPRTKVYTKTDLFDSSKKMISEVPSISNPSTSPYSRTPHQSSQFYMSSHTIPSPPSIPLTRNSLSNDSLLSATHRSNTNLTQRASLLDTTAPQKPYLMGGDVDDFMRQQGYLDEDNNRLIAGKEKNICVEEEYFPGISNSDEELYHITEEHEMSCSIPIEDSQRSIVHSFQDSNISNSHNVVEINSNSSSPLPSPHQATRKKQLNQGQDVIDVLYSVDVCDEISWSPLSSQLSQKLHNSVPIAKQVPMNSKLDVLLMKNDTNSNSVKHVTTNAEQPKLSASMNSPRCYGLVQAWPRTSNSQTTCRATIECLPEKRNHEGVSASNERIDTKNNVSPQQPCPSMFVPQYWNSALESYVPGKLFDGIFDM